jgi:transcriptional regulator of acetoin/glycerol metabolism
VPAPVPPQDTGSRQIGDKQILLQTIRECSGNMSRVAEVLGISRNTLYRRCKHFGIPLQRPR